MRGFFMERKIFGSQIIGDGSASLAVFVAADKKGVLPILLNDHGVAVIGPNPRFGTGILGEYQIQANSKAPDFFEGVDRGGVFAQALESPEAILLAAYGEKAAPLPIVGDYLSRLGTKIEEVVSASSKSRLLKRWVGQVRLGPASDGVGQSFISYDEAGGQIVESRRIIFATGGREFPHPALKSFGERFIFSGDILTNQALPKVEELLRGVDRERRRIAIVGGSHSGLVAVAKVKDSFGSSLAGIDVISRRAPREFYETVREAQEAGLEIDQSQDVCPIKERVNRFGGLRGPAASEYRRIRVEGQSGVARLHNLSIAEAEDVLKNAAVVIQALGYGANLVPIIDSSGKFIGPQVGDNRLVNVDVNSRVYDNNGKIIPTAYGIGLGYGIRPSKEIGGEASFRGVLDGFNVVCTVVAPRIIEDLLNQPDQAVLRREAVYIHA